LTTLNTDVKNQALENMSFILELLTNDRYATNGETNRISAQGCWYDPMMWQSFGGAGSGHISTKMVRALKTGKDI
jgi:pullulanase